MDASDSTRAEATLQKEAIHQAWEASYRTKENEAFYEMAFDRLASLLGPRGAGTILDAGCGIGAHSVRLARRGYAVTAVDFSQAILDQAAANLRAAGVQDSVSLRRDSLVELSFADESFDHVLCWGVLMHVPEVEKAVAELVRVLRKGGRLVISEGNMRSFQESVVRVLRPVLGKAEMRETKTPAGIEAWINTSDGVVLRRQADIAWLRGQLERRGLAIEAHIAGQFSEFYTYSSSVPIQRLFHAFNRVWFRRVKSPRLAYGNILIARKD